MVLAPQRTLHSLYYSYHRRAGACSRRKNKRERKITICGYSLPFICKRLLLPAGASPRPTETVIFIFCGSSYGNSAKRPLAARPTEIRKNIGNVVFLGKQVLPAEASTIQPQVIFGGQLLEAFSLGKGGTAKALWMRLSMGKRAKSYLPLDRSPTRHGIEKRGFCAFLQNRLTFPRGSVIMVLQFHIGHRRTVRRSVGDRKKARPRFFAGRLSDKMSGALGYFVL